MLATVIGRVDTTDSSELLLFRVTTDTLFLFVPCISHGDRKSRHIRATIFQSCYYSELLLILYYFFSLYPLLPTVIGRVDTTDTSELLLFVVFAFTRGDVVGRVDRSYTSELLFPVSVVQSYYFQIY